MTTRKSASRIASSPAPTTGAELANRQYVDDAVAAVSGGATGVYIGTTEPVATGEYAWVQTDGAGNFLDLIVGKN